MKQKPKKKQPSKKVVKKVVKKEKKKVNYKKLFAFIIFIYLIFMVFNLIFNIRIRNIIVKGNGVLSDQKIIDIAGISKYPSFFKTFSFKMKDRLEDNVYILKASVTKKFNREVIIEVTENYPMFYNSSLSKTVLFDGTVVGEKFITPSLMNYVPDNIYSSFIFKMKDINIDILERISEIRYMPNDVDDSRFILLMNDGNYVYLTLEKFDNINDYVSIMENIIAKFGNEKGILHLDSGGYFDLIE